MTRCDQIVKSANEPYPTWRCDLERGHEGSHRATVADVEWPRDLAEEAFVAAVGEWFAAAFVAERAR